MNRRTAKATGLLLALCLPLMAACSDDSEPKSPATDPSSSSNSATPDPSATASSDLFDPADVNLVGTWRDDAADWTVHFAEDGTYTVDFQGHSDFLTGNYEVDGSTLLLIGLDGNTQEGTITDAGLEFALGTLTPR